jgi:Leucine-rich repeat (LRR) protein
MAKRHDVLVIFDSEDLRTWWLTLSESWKNAFTRAAPTSFKPSNEELVRVTNIDSIVLQPDTLITSLEPLRKLRKLRVLIAAGTGISDLSPLKENEKLERIDISNTAIRDIQVVAQLHNATYINADNTEIQNINPLTNNKRLRKLSVNHTGVSEFHVQEFLRENRNCIVIYKSSYLRRWWDSLPQYWREIFQ